MRIHYHSYLNFSYWFKIKKQKIFILRWKYSRLNHPNWYLFSFFFAWVLIKHLFFCYFNLNLIFFASQFQFFFTFFAWFYLDKDFLTNFLMFYSCFTWLVSLPRIDLSILLLSEETIQFQELKIFTLLLKIHIN